ncbi:MAG: transglutaminase-like cysteine peptidase [Mesorhizobium sp.]|nr:transglutaminase-like cysteine peptidase [Mesorhizobium sp.]MBL8578905.1 transglutaminase-like cysteine peptidase [Mesorhizobium sp.]
MTKLTGTSLLLSMVMGLGAWVGVAQAEPAYMPTGGRTTQPIGHYELCQREAIECNQKTPKKAPVELTRQLWSSMIEINNAVNAAVEPRTDMDIWGKEEVWSYPTNVGDCEDYALEKRRRLMEIGVAPGDLLITVARQPNGDGHAVLTVRTSRGEFILDNLEGKVKLWTETPYTYLKRQSERNSGAWIAIDDSRSTIAVGSVK